MSDNTDRTAETWDGNPMTAALAFDGDELIGAVPFEKRTLAVGNGSTVSVLWITAAHIAPEYRSKGIGGALLRRAPTQVQGNFEAYCVYREDETSGAYQWYAQEGFHPLLPILAFRKDVRCARDGEVGRCTVSLVENCTELAAIEDELLACHARCTADTGGFPRREAGFWSRVFGAHYYREMNEYSLVILREGDSIEAFALLARTDMRDGIDRFDILEFVAEAGDRADRLHHAIEAHAASAGIGELRLQLSAQEPLRGWAEANGYIYRDRRTNILGRIFDAPAFLGRRWRERIERDGGLVIETPHAGRVELGSGKGSNAACFMADSVLDQLAFQRARPADLIREGQIICTRDPEQCGSILESMFPAAQWRYFQVDYI